ncbi:MAG TPA: divergent polysaccharide deacetylase family protein, partial [Hyphomicrobiales bacterium]
MRLLFYTATAVLLTLAGVFAFYALRSDDGVGTKIVLSIDTSSMPESGEGAQAGGENTSVAEVDTQPQDSGAPAEEQQQQLPESNAGKNFDITVNEAPSAGDSAAAPEPAPDTPTVVTAEEAPPAQPERLAVNEPPASAGGTQEVLPVLPGTSFEGIAPRPRAGERVAVQAIETPVGPSRLSQGADASLGAPRNDEPLRETLLPGRDRPEVAAAPNGRIAAVAQPEAAPSAAADRSSVAVKPADANDSQEGKANIDAVLAALNQQAETAPPAVEPAVAADPPPPLPLKRPSGVKPPTRTAALQGWTSSEVATPRPIRIAILLRGVGRDDDNSNEAVTNLPSAVSLAFMPYNGGAQQWATKARELGHEVIVQLPLEPSDYPVNNPGPETLLSSSSADQNLSRMRAVLRRFNGYTGVTNFLGGRILQSKTALKPILEDLKSQGLIYVGEGNNSHAVV